MIQTFIGDNPYRILGVYVGDSIAKETSNRNRISAYSKVGQMVTFVLKGDGVLPVLKRSGEMAADAAQALSLPVERLKYALFWYADEKYLWAFTLNSAIDALVAGNLASAFCHYESLIQDDALRNEFVKTVTHGLFVIEKEKLANMLIDILSEHVESTESALQSGCINQAHYLATVFFERKIWGELYELCESFTEGESDFYMLIDNFRNVTMRIMYYIKVAAMLFGTTDERYRRCAETVVYSIGKQGKAILTCIGEWLNSERAFVSVKLCHGLMEEVFEFVDSTIEDIALDDESCKNVAAFVSEFEEACFVQTAIVRQLLKVIRRKECIKTVLWLAFLIVIFLVMMM